MTGPFPPDAVPRVDLSYLSSKALTCLLQEQGLEDCKPKRAARKAIQRFLALSMEDQRRGLLKHSFRHSNMPGPPPFLQSTSCGPLPPSCPQPPFFTVAGNQRQFCYVQIYFYQQTSELSKPCFSTLKAPCQTHFFQTYVQQSSKLICASSFPPSAAPRPSSLSLSEQARSYPTFLHQSFVACPEPVSIPSASIKLGLLAVFCVAARCLARL